MISSVVFDFDGTIANSMSAMIQLYNQVAAKRGFKLMQEADFDRLRKLSFMERCREMDVSLLKLPSLVMEVRKSYKDFVGTVAPFEGMIPVLQTLHRHGINIGIISTNSSESIGRFLAENRAESLVHCIYCSGRVFGKDKLIARYLKTFGLSPEQVLYVGDEQRDVLACKKTRLRVLAVSWGVDSQEQLARAGPDFIAHRPADILERVEQLNDSSRRRPSTS